MNTTHSNLNATRSSGALLIVTALLSFAPVAILAPAIGWPASLSNPAAMQLDAIRAAPAAVKAGYALYLLYSVLIAPALFVVVARVFGTFDRPLAITVSAFAALSTLARSIGIVRWLTVMPALAASHASSEASGKLTTERIFDAVNSFGGGIGELLGVSLFMGIAMLLLNVFAWKNETLPRVLAGFGIISAVLLLALFAPSVGLAFKVPVAAAVTMLSVWMLGVGAWFIFRKQS